MTREKIENEGMLTITTISSIGECLKFGPAFRKSQLVEPLLPTCENIGKTGAMN